MARKKATPDTLTEETVENMVAVAPAEEQAETVLAVEAAKSPKETTRTAKHSNRYATVVTKVDKNTTYPVTEAVALAKETATTKFTGSVEAHLVVNQKGLRGFVTFPHSTGRNMKVLVFGDVKETDGVIPGNDQSIDHIVSNKLVPGKDFNMVIATPAYMPKLAKVAKILGPKGLMPNPKSGTLTDKPENALKNLLGGQAEYKAEANAPLIHLAIGKTNSSEKDLADNLTTLIASIGPSKIRQVTINATMGPGIRVKLS